MEKQTLRRRALLLWLPILTGALLSFVPAPASPPSPPVETAAVTLSQQAAKKDAQAGQSYAITRATSRIKVDGLLDEEAWSKACVIPLLFEWTPGDNVPPPVKTDVLVTYDDDYFYVAFRAFDPEPATIRAHIMDRDAIDTFIQDDHVLIVLDTFNDERRGFQFRVNPLGVQADANFSELEGYEDFSWDAIWDSAGKIADWGYGIEIAIPFNQLRFPRTQEAQTWGFSAERSYPRNVRSRILSHRQERDIACIICQFNKLTGIEGITPGRNVELDPTLTANRTDLRPGFVEGPMENGKAKVDPGITARWGITPNLIMNATANPDFSQVEADVAQLDVNTRFALFYPEKRPFFLEGADFFLTPFQAVFTRTVADPTGGLKLTGKAGRNALGVFGAYDRINNLIFPSNQGSVSTTLDQDVASGVLRYRRDIGRNSTFGVLYTGRAAEDYYNHVAGFDGFFRLSPTRTLSFQYLHSETLYPEKTASDYGQPQDGFGGDAFYAEFQSLGRDWYWLLQYKDLAPDFRADYGYIPRVDVRSGEGVVQRIVWGKQGSWFTQLAFGLEANVVYDHGGNLTDQEILLAGAYRGPSQSNIQLMLHQNKELYQNVLYDLTRAGLFIEIKPASGLSFNLQGRFGDSVDYNNSRKAGGIMVTMGTELGVGRHINVNFNHTLERLTLHGNKIYTANLPQLRLIYNFNVRTFVRAIFQYMDVDRNQALFLAPVPAGTKTFFTQLLFSYKINPQTVLFLGYSDNYFGQERIALARTDRTFFVKIGYAWTD
jgi:hypothetical protein